MKFLALKRFKHIHNFKRTLLISVLLLASLAKPAFAQVITMEQTVNYINSKLGKQCKIEVVKGNIIAHFFEKNEEFRKDKAPVKELDMIRIGFEPEENIFFIPCNNH
jgi:hypothetical protein